MIGCVAEPGPEGDRRAPGAGLERLASLRFTYFAIAAFMVLYLVTIDGSSGCSTRASARRSSARRA